tara:strand:- start:135 stop:458 length:324 start_codon:yes stop_codon:yes gene_type:complete
MNKTTAEDFIKESRREYIYYETDGTRSPSETKKTCAFVIVFEQSSVYLIKFFRSRPFDPNGVDTNKINSIQSEYKKVAKETFDLYVEYLSTNKRELFLRAERKCLDG